MARTPVEKLYREGRRYPSMEAPHECYPQFEVRAPGYENDVPNNWLRGMPSAENKPGFNSSVPRSKMRR
jgi:hypothetical protein